MQVKHLFFLISIMGLSSCTTDVDLTAPYKSIPVVFGLLAAELATQWVRINRTWLGEGDQTQVAQIADSSEYDPTRLHAQFVEVINGIDGRVFELNDTLLQDKEDDGVFFAPEHREYFVSTRHQDGDDLNPDAVSYTHLTLPTNREV